MTKFIFSIVVFIAIFFKPGFVFSQIQNLKGIIVDATTNLPVPFASILQVKTTKGAISNNKGEFSIALNGSAEVEVRVSSIGYKTIFQKFKATKDKVIISLKPDETQLREVVIMPDSLLKHILSRAYKNISANYYQTPIELTGFYRESRKSKEGKFLYFGEAILKVQHKGYQYTQQEAQVEMLKACITNFPNSDSIDNVKYYQGPFIAHWGDFVRTRASFLNPRSFNKEYRYTLEAISSYNEKKDTVYVISFKSKSNEEKKSGRLWINKKNLVYLKIEFENRKEYRQSPIIPVKFLIRKYQTLYVQDGDKYFLKYTSMVAENFNIKTQKYNIPIFEFATTNYTVGDSLKMIDPEKRLGYMTIFSIQENNYDEHFWDSYTSIEKDSSLKNQIQLHYSTKESKLINQPESTFNKASVASNEKQERMKRIIQIAQRVHGGYGISMNYYRPLNGQPLELIYQQLPVPIINYKLTHQIFPTYTFYTGFDLNKRMSIQTRTTHNLLKENYYYSGQLNFNRSYLVKKIGNPIVLKAVLGISAIKTGFYLADISSTNVIKLDGQDLGYTTKAYLGEKTFNGVIGLELDFVKKRRHLFLTVQYNPIMWRGDALFFKTKKNIFFTKNATVTDFSGIVSINNSAYRGVGNFSMTLGLGL